MGEQKDFTARIVPTDKGATIVPIEKGWTADDAIQNLGGQITKATKSNGVETGDSNAHVTVEDLENLDQSVYDEEHPDPLPIKDGKNFVDMYGNHYDKYGNPLEGNPTKD
jgi:hypothetical protein